MSKRIKYKHLSDADAEAERIIAEYVEWSTNKRQDKALVFNLQKQNKLLMRCLMKCIEDYPGLRESEHVRYTLEECTK